MAETPDELARRAAVEAQEQAHAERIATRQRSQVDTAKVVVTFAQAIAATLVGTGLQVTPNLWPDAVATVLLGFGFLLALVTVFADRLIEPDFGAISPTETDTSKLKMMQVLITSCARSNEAVVGQVKFAAAACLFVSFLAGLVAAVALLVGGT
ncbi:hypothetical protein DMP17_44840 [Pseudonocardia sp. TMWB2A]|uniref:hypothetical protein n=1 Tax=Pseudonocardia sp. TMWB2A TaxID=687430 RepID=UPI00307F8811